MAIRWYFGFFIVGFAVLEAQNVHGGGQAVADGGGNLGKATVWILRGSGDFVILLIFFMYLRFLRNLFWYFFLFFLDFFDFSPNLWLLSMFSFNSCWWSILHLVYLMVSSIIPHWTIFYSMVVDFSVAFVYDVAGVTSFVNLVDEVIKVDFEIIAINHCLFIWPIRQMPNNHSFKFELHRNRFKFQISIVHRFLLLMACH